MALLQSLWFIKRRHELMETFSVTQNHSFFSKIGDEKNVKDLEQKHPELCTNCNDSIIIPKSDPEALHLRDEHNQRTYVHLLSLYKQYTEKNDLETVAILEDCCSGLGGLMCLLKPKPVNMKRMRAMFTEKGDHILGNILAELEYEYAKHINDVEMIFILKEVFPCLQDK
ncbi:MAG: hypothetical protein Terrestrivirus4_115 [Terrestrivirus sp.]|uniref:Uncharacterized protein n=1 Tax=Terrestrivirus sp. TaxID=2487775 RepID=A0A3G4ZMJ2_9VIRU|nr:MAG: hypothetical protein Terrestrivirus4_115 [Terrestrivirus sp.]